MEATTFEIVDARIEVKDDVLIYKANVQLLPVYFSDYSIYWGGPHEFVTSDDIEVPKFYSSVTRVTLPAGRSCECGAYKTSNAPRGNPAHSSWCPWSRP